MQPPSEWKFVAFVLLLGVVNQERLCAALDGPRLSDERFVFQTGFGDIEMALYPDVCDLREIGFVQPPRAIAGLPV